MPAVNRGKSSTTSLSVLSLCCVTAPKKTCPVWPKQLILTHWSSADPAAVEGSNKEKFRTFWPVAQQINRRLELLSYLPFGKLNILVPRSCDQGNWDARKNPNRRTAYDLSISQARLPLDRTLYENIRVQTAPRTASTRRTFLRSTKRQNNSGSCPYYRSRTCR